MFEQLRNKHTYGITLFTRSGTERVVPLGRASLGHIATREDVQDLVIYNQEGLNPWTPAPAFIRTQMSRMVTT